MSTKYFYEYCLFSKCNNTTMNNTNIYLLMFRWIQIYVLKGINECIEKKIN